MLFIWQKENSSDQESYLPPAAKDSTWVGLQVYNNPHCTPDAEDSDDEEEVVQIINSEREDRHPILIIFPGLKEVYPKQATIVSGSESTTNITKSLVGQKADFAYLKTAKKLKPYEVITHYLLYNFHSICPSSLESPNNRTWRFTDVCARQAASLLVIIKKWHTTIFYYIPYILFCS